jgi:hypothetical protein
MVDNSVQGGADTIRDKDRAGVKTEIVGIDVGIGTDTEALLSNANPMPVQGAIISTQSFGVTAATPVTGTGLDATYGGSVVFVVKNTVAATAFTGIPVIVFEQSDDNVQWCSLSVTSDNGATGSTPWMTTGSSNGEQIFRAPLVGTNWVRVRVTTAQATNDMTVVTIVSASPLSPSVGINGVVSIALSNLYAVLTKGTQNNVGFSTQDLKDSGRVSKMYTATVASTTAAETLITLTHSFDCAATATASSNPITSGKRFRIQSIIASARESTGSLATTVSIKLRANASGATTATSPLQLSSSVYLAASPATVLFPPISIPDGFEIDADGGAATFGITITHPQYTTGYIVTFDISIIGYEY